MRATRLAFLTWVLAKDGAPYVWAAKGPECFDCSGLVTAGLQAVGGPDWRNDHSAHVLSNVLEHIDAPKPGDLCCYGPPGLINHVMIWMGDGRVYGASGGNHDTTSREIAAKQGARVRYRSEVKYRKDFRCYLRMPLEDAG